MKRMITCIVPVVVACAVFNPESGTTLADTMNPVVFNGLFPEPNAQIRLEAWNRVTQAWVAFGPTILSEATPTVTDCGDVSYYFWSANTALPDDWPYWLQTGAFNPALNHGESTIRVRAMAGNVQLPTLPQGGLNCVIEHYYESCDGESAIEACQTPDAELDLSAPCGDYAKNCCSYAPACGLEAACLAFGAGSATTKCEPDQLPTLSVTNYPSDKQLVENLQGVTHDANYWYFTHTDGPSIFRFPVTADLAANNSTTHHSPFGGYSHYGDPCYYQGRIFVPLEGAPSGHINGIGSVTTSFADARIFELAEAATSPWCAIHSGILYTSNDNATVIRRYDVSSPTQLVRLPDMALRQHNFTTPFLLNKIAGGAVSDNGSTLYLSSNDLKLIYAFDLPTGALRSAKEIVVPHWGCSIWPPDFCVDYGEVEGMDFWNDPTSPGINGQLHVIILHVQDALPNEIDNYTFAHYSGNLSRL